MKDGRMSEHGGAPPPGWYPEGDGWERRWDGSHWTDDRRPAGSGGPSAPAGPPAGSLGGPTQVRSGDAGGPSGPPPAAPPSSTPGYGAIGSSPYQPQQPYGPPGGGFGAPGGYQPPDAPGFGRQPKKSLLWLWVVLAVVLVLVIGTGVTLAVTQPWSDDGTSSAGGDGDGGDDGDGDGGGGGGGGEADLAARSDFDGDGKGDVAGIFFDGDGFALETLTSADGSFEIEEAASGSASLIWDDWDGDGTATALSWDYASYRDGLTIEAVVGEFDDQSWNDFQLYEDAEYWLRLDAADVTGDGLPDLIVVGQTGPLEVTVWTLAGTGEEFEDPVEWAVLEDATYGSTQIFPGDVDQDGLADLITLLPTDASSIPPKDRGSTVFSGEQGTVLLRSTGEAFEPESDELGESPFDDRTRVQRRVAVGDFRGDGSTLIAMQAPDYSSSNIVFFEYDDGDLVEADDFEGDFDDYVRTLTAADVNGDGMDDVVAVSADSDDDSALFVDVLLSEGDGIGDPERWTEFECDDSCSLEFDAGSRI
jgi:hypothetical protein